MDTKKNVLLKFEAGGKTLVTGTGSGDFRAFGLSGLSGLEFDFTTSRSPQSPNTVLLNQKPLPREVTLGLRFDTDKRGFLSGFFSPLEKGRLSVKWDETERYIEYFPKPVRIEQSSVYRDVTAFIELFCPEPYWLSIDDYGKNIASRVRLLAFPFAFSGGIVADYRFFSTEVEIENSGDVPVPCVIVFTAKGNVKNPSLSLNGSEFVRAEVDMVKGDTVEFSTDASNLYAVMNGVDILNHTDPIMTFFQIPKGKSVIEYRADDGAAELNVYVYFRRKYLGI